MTPIFRKLHLTLPLLAVILLSGSRPAAAKYTTFFLNSGSATLNSQGLTGNFSAVYEGGALPTDTYFDDAVLSGSSLLTLQNGGSLGQLIGGDSTTISIQGGSVSSIAEGGAPNGLYTLNVSGGSIFSIDLATIPGTTTISGGSIGVFADNGGNVVNITGGSVGITNGLSAGFSQYNISGGAIGNIMDAGATFNFFGSALAFKNGQVTGVLTDGTAINSMLTSKDGLQVLGDSNHLIIENAPVPEASTFASLGFLLLLGGAAARSSRRRQS